jgi:hypothetical protein
LKVSVPLICVHDSGVRHEPASLLKPLQASGARTVMSGDVA